LWKHLRAYLLAGYKFRRQQPVGPYVVDFVCFTKKLIIELDGAQHSQPDEAEYDQARTDWLQARGFQVIRFWNNQVLAEIESVKTVILTTLEANDSNQ
jgi:very-short-patch-repair endonuclease